MYSQRSALVSLHFNRPCVCACKDIRPSALSSSESLRLPERYRDILEAIFVVQSKDLLGFNKVMVMCRDVWKMSNYIPACKGNGPYTLEAFQAQPEKSKTLYKPWSYKVFNRSDCFACVKECSQYHFPVSRILAFIECRKQDFACLRFSILWARFRKSFNRTFVLNGTIVLALAHHWTVSYYSAGAGYRV
jgi:hypothetical protein